MDISPELFNLVTRFGFNLAIAFIIIKLIRKLTKKEEKTTSSLGKVTLTETLKK